MAGDSLGDRDWTKLLDAYEAVATREVARLGGTYVKSTGDGSLAAFDGPIRGVQCALAIQSAAAELGLQIRCGLHTGPVERRGRDITGIAVHIAARVLGVTHADEVLLTRATADLLTGSTIHLHDRGEPSLNGVPRRWHLQAVRADAARASTVRV